MTVGDKVPGWWAGSDYLCDASGASCGPHHQPWHGCLSVPQRPFHFHLQTRGWLRTLHHLFVSLWGFYKNLLDSTFFLNHFSSMKWTCQGKSALLSLSQRSRGLVQLWSLRTWIQTWRVSHYSWKDLLECFLYCHQKWKGYNLNSRLFVSIIMKNCQHYIFTVSEVAMESSPGPSTSSGSRPEADHRAQSSTANTPRAGTCSKHTQKETDVIIVTPSSIWHTVSAGMQCIPQRAALLKSMLNFLKKAIQDPAFSDGIRHGESLAFSNSCR